MRYVRWKNRETNMRDHMRHMQNQRLKLAEFRLVREIREKGDTPQRQKRLAQIRRTLYPQVFGDGRAAGEVIRETLRKEGK